MDTECLHVKHAGDFVYSHSIQNLVDLTPTSTCMMLQRQMRPGLLANCRSLSFVTDHFNLEL